MFIAKSSWFRSSLTTVIFLLLACFTMPAIAQEAPPVRVGPVQITGMPDDWTHHHLVFANPGTEQEAIRAGRHEQRGKRSSTTRRYDPASS